MAIHILLLEDHADTAHALARLLENEGYRVTIAGRLREAVSICRRDDFDLLLLDLKLPDGDAMTLPQQLGDRCTAPAIVLSAEGDAERQEEARRRGFADYLLKPVTMDVIRSAIARALPNAKEQRAATPVPLLRNDTATNQLCLTRFSDSVYSHAFR